MATTGATHRSKNGRGWAALLACFGVVMTLGVASGSAATPLSFARPATYPAGDSPTDVAVGDLNGDGKPDLVSPNEFDNTVSVLLNKGGGVFRPKRAYRAGEDPGSVAIGDVNGDSRPDVVTTIDEGISVLLNTGKGNFATKSSYRSGLSVDFLLLHDLNGDRKEDVVAVGYSRLAVLFNDGKGGFKTKREYTLENASAAAVDDLNSDGKPDLAIATVTGVTVLLNAGDGTFGRARSYRTEARSREVAAGDLNGDGKPDIVTADADGDAVSVLLNKGDGTFEAARGFVTGRSPSSVAIADLNSDGKPDIITVASRIDSVSAHLNNGDGSFGTRLDFRTGEAPGPLAVGDLNGDGKPDVVTVCDGDALFVLLNTTGAGPQTVRRANANGTIVFAGNRSGNFEIRSIRADGSRPGQLTRNLAQEKAPVFSPDGRRIAFLRSSRVSGYDLWVMNADGNRLRKLARVEEGSRPAWSPDSRRIAFQAAWIEKKDAFPIVVAGIDWRRRVVVPRGRNSAPSWSPDGKRLAFLREVGDRNDLMTVRVDGRGLTTVRRNVGESAAWSPAGNLIAFAAESGLTVVRADGLGARKLAWRAGAFAWSPDGRRLAFVVAGRLYIVPASGGDIRDVTPDAVGRLGSPAWSPDGCWLAVRSAGPDAPAGTGDLFVVSADGSAPRRVAIGASYPFGADNQSPTWRPRRATRARLGRPPARLSPSETASRSTLRSVGSISGLAADGGHVAAIFGSAASDCAHVSVWSPGSRPVHLGMQLPTCVSDGYEKDSGSVALAGKRVAWIESSSSQGNTESDDEYAAKVATTASPALVGEIPEHEGEHGVIDDDTGSWTYTGSDMWFVHGGGDLLAFNTWSFCQLKDPTCKTGETWRKRRVSDERIWRIEGSRRVEVRSGSGTVAVNDVDADRIAVVEPGGAVDVVGADGTLIRRFALQVRSAQLSGSQLAVLTATGLQAFDVATGARNATVPLPSSTARVLTGFDRGIAVYLEGRTVHVVRLADKHQFSFSPKGEGPVFAQLDPAGMFTGYTVRSGSRPGRVELTSLAALERRLR